MPERRHRYQDLIAIFNACFAEEYNTRLLKGEDEPVYLPATTAQPYHGIYFAHGFFSSALHECAHWLLAGEARREKIDYGYWYIPDGRSAEQQKLFQSVEVKPQALEWILSLAAGYRFQLSFDNLNGDPGNYNAFKYSIYQQIILYCAQGLSVRAEKFRRALCTFYNTEHDLCKKKFEVTIS